MANQLCQLRYQLKVSTISDTLYFKRSNEIKQEKSRTIFAYDNEQCKFIKISEKEDYLRCLFENIRELYIPQHASIW